MFANLYKRLEAASHKWQGEEEVRIGWIQELSAELGITFHAERGRLDACYNLVVIEFKDKGLFGGKITSPAFKNALNERLEPYILKKSKSEGLDPSDYIGIGIDGDHIFFAYMRKGKIEHGQLMPFSPASTSMVAQALLDSKRRAVTAENLIEDFGHASDIGTGLMQAMSDALVYHLKESTNNKIKMLFEEWRTIFGQVADMTKAQQVSIEQAIRFTVAISGPKKVPATLFVIHTYNTLLMKLLAAEIVSEHGLTSFKGYSEFVSNLEDQKLLEQIKKEIEDSQLFEAAGIKGFVEEAIFSWYLDSCPKHAFSISSKLRDVLISLALYRTDNLDTARSNDVLKAFYQSLVPDVMRKSLGEFYTPDWLVDYTYELADIQNWEKCRILDPTCGSGSFLLKAITKKRKSNKSPSEMLTHLIQNVYGFDLNPLAVQLSRVNFLIAIADLLEACPGAEIEIPVLLADAVYSPARNPLKGEEIVNYKIGSPTANLEINLPSALAFDRKRLDDVFAEMAIGVSQEKSYKEIESLLEQKTYISKEEANSWRTPLRETYDNVLDLHKKNWNGIWFRIVRNFFWSATSGEFNLVIGNPPWVRWSNLPNAYREKIKPTCESYKIFSSTPHHGGNELDISGMITYVAADKWLKNDGKLIFLLTQTHFQSPSSEGFRRFKLNSHNLVPERVDDMKILRPFPDAANKTSILVIKKNKNDLPKYPVPYYVWDTKKNFPKEIPTKLSIGDVKARVTITEMEANPVGDEGSPWAILAKGRFKQLKKISGKSGWVNGRKGITADLNGVYFIKVLRENKTNRLVEIETRPEAGRHDIGPKRTFWIEPDLLFPLLKGASDFSEFTLKPKSDLYVIVPNCGIVKKAYNDTKILMTKLKKTSAYFHAYANKLRERSTYKKRMPSAPYYCVYNVGEYTFSPYKVIWAEMPGKKFKSAVASNAKIPILGNRPYVPDHKIYFADFQQEEPAYYLCALINSEIVSEFIQCHTIGLQVGNIFKHLKLPNFDAKNKIHNKIAEISKKAHFELDASKKSKLIIQCQELADQILR